MNKEKWLVAIVVVLVWTAVIVTVMSKKERSGLETIEKCIEKWEPFVVSLPRTRVWRLAVRYNPGGRYDTRKIVALILKKNLQIDKRYELRPGDTVLLPVLKTD